MERMAMQSKTADTADALEILEWRDHDSDSEITYTGFGPYMVERLGDVDFRAWFPDSTKNSRIKVEGFTSRHDARSACQSDVDSRRGGVRSMQHVFERYIGGTLMAEGVTIEREPSLEKAMVRAAQIASRGPNGETPVLIYRPRPE